MATKTVKKSAAGAKRAGKVLAGGKSGAKAGAGATRTKPAASGGSARSSGTKKAR